MLEGIRDTSAQDVVVNKATRTAWLKWAVPAAVLLLLILLGSGAYFLRRRVKT